MNIFDLLKNKFKKDGESITYLEQEAIKLEAFQRLSNTPDGQLLLDSIKEMLYNYIHKYLTHTDSKTILEEQAQAAAWFKLLITLAGASNARLALQDFLEKSANRQ
jgi:hypothetical protein